LPITYALSWNYFGLFTAAQKEKDVMWVKLIRNHPFGNSL